MRRYSARAPARSAGAWHRSALSHLTQDAGHSSTATPLRTAACPLADSQRSRRSCVRCSARLLTRRGAASSADMFSRLILAVSASSSSTVALLVLCSGTCRAVAPRPRVPRGGGGMQRSSRMRFFADWPAPSCSRTGVLSASNVAVGSPKKVGGHFCVRSVLRSARGSLPTVSRLGHCARPARHEWQNRQAHQESPAFLHLLHNYCALSEDQGSIALHGLSPALQHCSAWYLVMPSIQLCMYCEGRHKQWARIHCGARVAPVRCWQVRPLCTPRLLLGRQIQPAGHRDLSTMAAAQICWTLSVQERVDHGLDWARTWVCAHSGVSVAG